MGFSGRKRKASARDSTPSETESLTPFLLRGLAWGIYSAVQVQQIAAASLRDYERRGYEPPATRLISIYIYIHICICICSSFFLKTVDVLYPQMYFNNLPALIVQ